MSKHKLFILLFKAFSRIGPIYLRDHLSLHYCALSQLLCSSSTMKLSIKWMRIMEATDRTYLAAGPMTLEFPSWWDLSHNKSLSASRTKWKTHFQNSIFIFIPSHTHSKFTEKDEMLIPSEHADSLNRYTIVLVNTYILLLSFCRTSVSAEE